MERDCKVCNIIKPLDCFYLKPKGLHGRDSICKTCKSEKSKQRWESLSDEDKKLRNKNKYSKENYKNHPEKYNVWRDVESKRKWHREYRKRRRNESPQYKLIDTIRTRVSNYLKRNNYSKNGRTFEIIGISPENLKEHISNQFKEGMSWENHGEWHIDHIMPLSSAKSESELYNLFHYSNLQPLWASENMSKGNKILID
jgi:hypothetical protein